MGHGPATSVPERVAWAVELLAPEPDDQILEVGCGPGFAVALVSECLVTGRIIGIDRSTVATERARARNTEPIVAGRAQVEQVELAHIGGRRSPRTWSATGSSSSSPATRIAVPCLSPRHPRHPDALNLQGNNRDAAES